MPAKTLTAQETAVMWEMAKGLSNEKIGKALKISHHTVKFHINNIALKLDAYSRTEAAVKFVLGRPAEARERLKLPEPIAEVPHLEVACTDSCDQPATTA